MSISKATDRCISDSSVADFRKQVSKVVNNVTLNFLLVIHLEQSFQGENWLETCQEKDTQALSSYCCYSAATYCSKKCNSPSHESHFHNFHLDSKAGVVLKNLQRTGTLSSDLLYFAKEVHYVRVRLIQDENGPLCIVLEPINGQLHTITLEMLVSRTNTPLYCILCICTIQNKNTLKLSRLNFVAKWDFLTKFRTQ